MIANEFTYDPDTVAYAAALVKMMVETPPDDRFANPALLWSVTRGIVSFDPRVLVMVLLLYVQAADELLDGEVARAAWNVAQDDLIEAREVMA